MPSTYLNAKSVVEEIHQISVNGSIINLPGGNDISPGKARRRCSIEGPWPWLLSLFDSGKQASALKECRDLLGSFL
jgi:hypothetical protein